MPWGTKEEIERRNRILLSIYAYAYEYSEPIVSDGEFDKLAYSIDVSIETGNPEMDFFFKEHFDPSTGMWIHSHPHLTRIGNLYNKFYNKEE